MDKDINKSIIKGVSWNFIETIISYFLRFFIGVILARLLMPSDFGLIGMVAVFIAVSDVFVRAGFGQAFIKKQDASDVDANTVFFINLGLGFLFYIFLFFGAPFIAQFFHQEQLIKIVKILGLNVVIQSLNVIQYSVIRKNMQFKKKAILTIISYLVSSVIAVVMAYKGYGVWSLVIQQLLKSLLLCVLFYVFSTWRPSFLFSFSSARSMFFFGGWLLLSDIFATIMNNFYRICIGRFYTSNDLGYYDRAHQFQSMIVDTFTWIFGMVAFPSFSKLQHDKTQMILLARKYVLYSSFIIYPLLSCLLVSSESIVLILLTEKWLGVVPYLKLFCIIGFCVPILFFLLPLLQAVGLSKLDFISTSLMSICRIVNVCVIFSLCLDMKFLLIGELIVQIFTLVVTSFIAEKKLGYNYLFVLNDVKYIVLFMIISLCSGELLLLNLVDFGMLAKLILPCCVIIIVYFLLLALFQYKFIKSLLINIKILLKR